MVSALNVKNLVIEEAKSSSKGKMANGYPQSKNNQSLRPVDFSIQEKLSLLNKKKTLNQRHVLPNNTQTKISSHSNHKN